MHQGSRTYRAISLGCVVASIFAAGYGASWAQTVLGISSPAPCLQNADNRAFACGSGATASPGTGATAVGVLAKAASDAAMAFGYDAQATSIAAMAFGQESRASDQGSTAFGQGAGATGTTATAYGFAARAHAIDAVSVGGASLATAHSAIAIGANTSAKFDSSIAIGANAETKAANQVVLGTATSIYALPGANSAASAGALKGPLKMLVIDANGNIGVADLPAPKP